jgi:hypothetical protein
MLAGIPENRPQPNPMGGGVAPMTRPPRAPRPQGDPRMMLAQKMAAMQRQKVYGNRMQKAQARPRPQFDPRMQRNRQY